MSPAENLFNINGKIMIKPRDLVAKLPQEVKVGEFHKNGKSFLILKLVGINYKI